MTVGHGRPEGAHDLSAPLSIPRLRKWRSANSNSSQRVRSRRNTTRHRLSSGRDMRGLPARCASCILRARRPMRSRSGRGTGSSMVSASSSAALRRRRSARNRPKRVSISFVGLGGRAAKMRGAALVKRTGGHHGGRSAAVGSHDPRLCPRRHRQKDVPMRCMRSMAVGKHGAPTAVNGTFSTGWVVGCSLTDASPPNTLSLATRTKIKIP